MTEILQDRIPYDLAPRRLPGVQPLDPGAWLMVDEAHAGQMALRRRLLDERREAVLRLDPDAMPAAEELFDTVLAALSACKDYDVTPDRVTGPDGVAVPLRRDDPLDTLGRLVQEDLCLMEKRGEEHVLTGAVLCFPAHWRLDEKFLRPLIRIHAPVASYDEDVAARVQRLFDGVRAGRPLWRFNRLRRAAADLFQPRSESNRADKDGPMPYLRSERQCILRLPKTEAVVFSIHTFVIRDGQA